MTPLLLSRVATDVLYSMPLVTASTSLPGPASLKDGLTIYGITLQGSFNPLLIDPDDVGGGSRVSHIFISLHSVRRIS